jgi:phospholipid/cholesterol/gamma-HCH transport system substrate-binding protein
MKKSNPKLIGVFVIGGLVLVVTALVLFSSQDLFTPKRFFVAYFQQSVNGLNIGAPVRFRGIPVGEVLQIDGIYDPETGNMIPRLTLEFHPETMENADVEEGEYTLLPFLLERSMRVSLKSASLLTGQLYVALDFYPGTPERYLGSGVDDYPELPTLDSGLEQVIAKLTELPVEELFARLNGALAAAQDLLRHPGLEESLTVLPTLLTDADLTIVDLRDLINREVAPVAREASQTLVTARSALQSLSTMITDESLVQVSSTLTEFEETLQLLQERLDANEPLMHELVATLREIGAAARSVRDLADALEEHPESLVRGKSSQ